MNILVTISKYMKNDAARISAVEYTAILTHENYVGVSSGTGGLVAADLSGDTSIEDMKEFVTALIAGDANLLSVHLSDLNFKYNIANSTSVLTSPPPTPEELREQMPTLSSRQFWLAANTLGITEDMLLAATDDAEIIIEIRKTTEFHRTYDSVVMLAPLMGITPEQLDGVWLWAAAV